MSLIIIPDIRQSQKKFLGIFRGKSLFFCPSGRKGLKLPKESFRIRCQIIPSVHENAGKESLWSISPSRHNPPHGPYPQVGRLRPTGGRRGIPLRQSQAAAGGPAVAGGDHRRGDHLPLPRLPEHIRQVQVPEDVMASISPVKTPQGCFSPAACPSFPAPDSHRPAVCAAGRGAEPAT